MEETSLSNHQIVVLALYLLGGETSYVHTEDIAVRANELAPGRFSWKRHLEQINLEHIRVFLTDAKKDKNGRLVGGSNRTGWILSDRGLAFARNSVSLLSNLDLSRAPVSRKEREWRSRERDRLEDIVSARHITPQNCDSLALIDVESLFRLDDYVAGEARARLIYRYLNAFGDDPTLGPVLRAASRRIRTDVPHE